MNQESPNVSVMWKAGLGDDDVFSFWLWCLQNVSQFRLRVLLNSKLFCSQKEGSMPWLSLNTVCFNIAVQAFPQIHIKDCPFLFQSQKLLIYSKIFNEEKSKSSTHRQRTS